eukprot:376787-Rhodomonas_salina.3
MARTIAEFAPRRLPPPPRSCGNARNSTASSPPPPTLPSSGSSMSSSSCSSSSPSIPNPPRHSSSFSTRRRCRHAQETDGAHTQRTAHADGEQTTGRPKTTHGTHCAQATTRDTLHAQKSKAASQKVAHELTEESARADDQG